MNNSDQKNIDISNMPFKDELSKIAEICDKLNELYERSNSENFPKDTTLDNSCDEVDDGKILKKNYGVK